MMINWIKRLFQRDEPEDINNDLLLLAFDLDKKSKDVPDVFKEVFKEAFEED